MRIGVIALFWLCATAFPCLFNQFVPHSSPSETSSIEKQSTTITANGGVLGVPDGND